MAQEVKEICVQTYKEAVILPAAVREHTILRHVTLCYNLLVVVARKQAYI
jgi:hypothetical protein